MLFQVRRSNSRLGHVPPPASGRPLHQVLLQAPARHQGQLRRRGQHRFRVRQKFAVDPRQRHHRHGLVARKFS